MPTLDEAFSQVRDGLLERFAESADPFAGLDPFTAMIAVALDRSGSGARLDQTLDALEQAGYSDSRGLLRAEPLEIADALSEAGVSLKPQQIAVLVRLAKWVETEYHGDADSLIEPSEPTSKIRQELAAVRGVGTPGTDAILLFALNRPSYPVDRATYRVLARHGWIESTASYEEARDTVVDHAADFAERTGREASDVLKSFCHGMDWLGRKFCRAAAPSCDGCPLEPLLPEGGPRQADG
jgi:endonuclease-3 related protein